MDDLRDTFRGLESLEDKISTNDDELSGIHLAGVASIEFLGLIAFGVLVDVVAEDYHQLHRQRDKERS